MSSVPVAVLVSGSGTNLQSLLDAAATPGFPARIAVVVSNVPGVRALERATIAGVPTRVLPHQGYPDRPAYDRALVETIAPFGCRIACLAGFMRLVGPAFLRAFPGGVLNVHPALLPSFPGLHAHRQALEHGVKMTGCTVHLVDEGTDTGPIVAQAAVPVLDADTEESLQRRIQEQEHRLFPLALGLLASGRLRVEGRRVHVEGGGPDPAGVALVNPGRL
ncbi:MAG TPA: phosphoribosylglycinamide formyltransferase [Myxococcaceae bacterium]